MSDTLYLQLDQNIEVTNPHVYLQDIAALSMSDPKILNRLRVMPVIVLDVKKPGRYVMSVSDLLKKIQKLEPSIDISPIGETDFIITYRISSATGKIFRYVKILFVCLVSFFGAAFSIMIWAAFLANFTLLLREKVPPALPSWKFPTPSGSASAY